MIRPEGIAQIVGALLFLLGVVIPMLGSAMIPNGSQRWGAAIFSLLGIGLFLGIGGYGANPLTIGMGVGFMLASAKLATGLRFL
jgi:hypothetical protein